MGRPAHVSPTSNDSESRKIGNPCSCTAESKKILSSRGFNFVFLLVTKIPYHAITLRAKGFVTRGPRAGLLCHATITQHTVGRRAGQLL